jgi:hypothetical protein
LRNDVELALIALGHVKVVLLQEKFTSVVVPHLLLFAKMVRNTRKKKGSGFGVDVKRSTCNVTPNVLSALAVVSRGCKIERVRPLHTLFVHRSLFLCSCCLWVPFLYLVLNFLYGLPIQLGMEL